MLFRSPQPPEPCTRPCPAHTSPAPGTSHVSLPGAGVSAALVLWGSWAGCGCPALRQQSDHLHWVVGPLRLAPRAQSCPPPTRRRKPSPAPGRGIGTFSKFTSPPYYLVPLLPTGIHPYGRTGGVTGAPPYYPFWGLVRLEKRKGRKTHPGRVRSAVTARMEPRCPVGARCPSPGVQSPAEAALVVLEATQNTPRLLDSSPAFMASERSTLSFRASWLLPTKPDSSPSLPGAAPHALSSEMCGACRPPR